VSHKTPPAFEIRMQLVTGRQAKAETPNKESASVLLPGLQANNDVKSFQVFDPEGPVAPEAFNLSSAFFTKWR